jgi:heat shock protein HtpX
MWEQIRSNVARSIVIIILMGALLLAIGYFIGFYLIGSALAGLVIALIIWIIMSLIGYFQGGSILLGVSGARKIRKKDNPQLYDVVEEMKIASGLPAMPDIYIINDQALNAFSTGRDPAHASVAITSGLLQKLNRDELEGVMGHEMGHVKNRDILLMSMASVLLGSIVILAWLATRSLFFAGAPAQGRGRRGSNNGGSAVQLLLLIVGLVLMILAPIFAQLLYFALSRRREYLADASSALYTRYPEGLASALEKLEVSPAPVKKANNATAPMYIVNPFRKNNQSREAASPMSTHPPTSERIRILRAMAGVSYNDYEKAYESVKRGSIIPSSALGNTTDSEH